MSRFIIVSITNNDVMLTNTGTQKEWRSIKMELLQLYLKGQVRSYLGRCKQPKYVSY